MLLAARHYLFILAAVSITLTLSFLLYRNPWSTPVSKGPGPLPTPAAQYSIPRPPVGSPSYNAGNSTLGVCYSLFWPNIMHLLSPPISLSLHSTFLRIFPFSPRSICQTRLELVGPTKSVLQPSSCRTSH